ncbi:MULTISPECIES: hypothetical protein [Chelatococcus]|uniref:Uncharacterized protein n=1 Tax=Chelatococcus caeni TaxID=1348468 RepID=A0A840BUI5_9HYPH|nr:MULTISPECIES: hypothetical protein [Chelatococcus]ALA18203.1 hypothetical protein AL346_13285 [Chelatococcus sp. CO-6]MBB4015322.1 hypothetical protein [Chelatococcus caeni]
MIVHLRIAALAACLAAPGAALAGGFYEDGCRHCGVIDEEWPIAAWRGGGANVHYSGGVVYAQDYWPARRAHHRHRIVSKSAPPRVIYGPR